jgi:hypothetical protein
VTLAELEAADTADSETEETGNVLRIEDFRCSHLDGNRPPVQHEPNGNEFGSCYPKS